jgi:hypothetical protein
MSDLCPANEMMPALLLSNNSIRMAEDRGCGDTGFLRNYETL